MLYLCGDKFCSGLGGRAAQLDHLWAVVGDGVPVLLARLVIRVETFLRGYFSLQCLFC